MWRLDYNSSYVTIPGREELSFIIPGTEYEIAKGDIASYLTPEHGAQVNMWRDWKTLGDPWRDGWANWPAVYKDIISAIEQESKVK